MKSQYLKQYNLPNSPGVYIFKEDSEILYVGKATSLKDRVKSYFGNDLIDARGPLLVEMVFKANNLEFIETDSVLEALILEANLIKKYQPKYNTKEKDDKSFNYVCITKEDIPKILIIRGRELKQKNQKDFLKIFGPFTSGNSLRTALKIIRKIFPFYDKNTNKKGYYEFYRQLGMAPDANESEFLKEYKNNIKNIILFFEGKKTKIIKELTQKMNFLAKELFFERANEIKKQIFALSHIKDVALIKKDFFEDTYSSSGFRIEGYDVAHLSGGDMVGVMTVLVDGVIEKNEYRKFKIKTVSGANDPKALAEILERRFNHPEWQKPDLIVVDGNNVQLNVAKEIVKKNNLNIEVVAVTKDENHKPKNILGENSIIFKYNNEILLVNNEAHRFSLQYHRDTKRKKAFSLKKIK